MRKGNGVFKKVEETVLVCDKCGEEIDILNQIVYNAKWSDGYDHYGGKWDFCCLDCMAKYITEDTKYPDGDLYFPNGEDVTITAPSSAMRVVISKLL